MIKKVLVEYPEFHRHLGAFAILKDCILLLRIVTFEFARKMAEAYPLLIISAPFVVKTMKAVQKTAALTLPTLESIDGLDTISEESSASDGESPAAASPNLAEIRRISRGQLATALMLAGTSSPNSLAHIANDGGDGSAATSTTTMPSTSTAGGSTSSTSTRISNSLFTNALSNAFGSTAAAAVAAAQVGASSLASTTITPPTRVRSTNDLVTPMDSSDTPPPSAAAAAAANPLPIITTTTAPNSVADSARQFVNELQTMREMGLTEEQSNLQALIIFNGNVEAAINLVLGGMGGFS